MMGGKVFRHWAGIGAVLVFGCGVAGAARAENFETAIAAAMKDVEAGRCEQAYRRLARIDGLESRARLLAGQCRVREGLYPEALADLDRVRGADDLTPEQVGSVELYRGIALYHLERYAEAAAALDGAEGLTSGEAELALYRGLIALRNGDNDRAAPSLEAAARLAPAMTEPVASYYAGLAWKGSAERAKARAAFQRVIDLDGDGPWGKEAAKLLESTELFPFFVKMSAGIEYDDNVVLRGGVTQIVPQGSTSLVVTEGEKDWRGVWRIDAGVELFRKGDWNGGLTGSYSGSAHSDLTEFNTQYPTVGAYVANQLDPDTALQARYQFGFAWVNEDSFLRAQLVELGVSHVWPRAGTTVAVADVIWNDLRFPTRDVTNRTGPPPGPCPPGTTGSGCGPIGLDEGHERDRDGVGIGGAVEHRYPIHVPSVIDRIFEEIEIGGGYRFRYYDSQGNEWKHMAHVFSASIEIELPLDFSVATRASYEFRDFLNESTYPDNEVIGQPYTLSGAERREHEVNVEAEIEKDLTESLSISARYSYLDNESNRRVFDYTRHIVGGYLNFRFE